jgi:SagB-type dehydrogenase family enzyme
MSVLDYHRATNVPAGGTDEDEARTIETRPSNLRDYGDAERVPLDASVAGALLQDGAGIVRSQPGRGYGGQTMHWRAYSSAGALYPLEVYVAAPDGHSVFDPLGRALVPLRTDDARRRIAAAAAADELEDAGAIVVVTGIHKRTGWKYMERGYRHIWWDAGTMLANLLALAAADGLGPRLYTAFADRELNLALGVNGVDEFALALLAVGSAAHEPRQRTNVKLFVEAAGRRFPLAEAAHEASSLADAAAVGAWRLEPVGEEPRRDRDELVRAIRRRSSVRTYAREPLPREALAELLAWSEAPIPADAPRVVRQLVTVAAVEGLEPGVYDAGLNLLHAIDEGELRERVGFAAMEQEHPRDAAVNVFQLADLADVVARLGDRGYRWAQLEAGIRAGRVQVGAFMRGWGAAASTFYDDEVSKLLGTGDAPLLMVAVGARRETR